MTSSVVMERENGMIRGVCTLSCSGGLIKVVSEMDYVVVLVFPGSIAVRVEIAISWIGIVNIALQKE